jgi:Na+-translocating ferredoxin:NAD+ oxidoreductase RnfG subunit
MRLQIVMKPVLWNQLLAGLLIAPIPYTAAQAQTYLTEDQAVNILFPNDHLEPRWMELTPDEAKAIAKTAKQKGLDSRVRVYWGPGKEAVVIDHVLGKHELITYAVGIDANGQVKGIEILDYRETYGSQIRDAEWRQNFVGKSRKDPVELDEDIPNISGATLSSKHITDGVRRVLVTYDTLKAKI